MHCELKRTMNSCIQLLVKTLSKC